MLKESLDREDVYRWWSMQRNPVLAKLSGCKTKYMRFTLGDIRESTGGNPDQDCWVETATQRLVWVGVNEDPNAVEAKHGGALDT